MPFGVSVFVPSGSSEPSCWPAFSHHATSGSSRSAPHSSPSVASSPMADLAQLIRRSQPPTRSDLRALLAFQLGVTFALAFCISAVFLPFGELGAVTALMALSLPLVAVRAPATILLERRLDYRPLAVIEIVETVCNYGWAITTVSMGSGSMGVGHRQRGSCACGQPPLDVCGSWGLDVSVAIMEDGVPSLGIWNSYSGSRSCRSPTRSGDKCAHRDYCGRSSFRYMDCIL